MKITKITPQMSNPERVNIFVDDEFYAGIDAFHLYGLGLRKGVELTEEQIAALKAVCDQEKCNSKAMSLLTYRDRTSFELRKRLREEGFAQETIGSTLQTLKNMGMLNDAAFVRSYTESVRGKYPHGRIISKLCEWGVPVSFSEPIVAELCDLEAEEELACSLAEKKLRIIKAASLYDRRAKLAAFLSGKGFDGETVAKAVSRVLQ